MTCSQSGTIVDLGPREHLVLTDVRGAVLRVNRGTLWITQEGDTRDVVLRAGDTWAVERQGATIVEAQTAATLCASGRRIGRALRGARQSAPAVPKLRHRALARLRAGFAAWWSLTPRRHIPHV